MCATVTAGCGALHDAPVSNAKANPNVLAAKQANPYDGVSQQAAAQEKKATQESAQKSAVKKAKSQKAEAQESKARKTRTKDVVAKKAKAAPAGGSNMRPVSSSSQIPDWVTAINWAQTKLGHKYIWGGDGYDNPYDGFDCSGLMLAAWKKGGVSLPRVAQDQYNASRNHPKWKDLRPGDLVFFGTRYNLHHVGMYLGSGMMIHAPNSRSVVRFNKVHYMSDYYGATRVSRD